MATDRSLALAVLLIFATLSVPTVYIAFRHGFRGMAILGWGYLFVFCSLKIVGSGMQMGDNPGSGAAIVTSIGLSPLLLAVAGVLHEARFYNASPEKRRLNTKKETLIIILFHMQVMLGIALVAVGMSRLASRTAQDQVDQGWKLAKIGAAVLLLGWVAVTSVAIRGGLTGHLRIKNQTPHNHGPRLLLAVLIALPFVGIRVIATFIYVLSENQSLSAMTGSLGARVGLYIVEEIVATLVMVSAGVVTRGIRKEREDEVPLDDSLGRP
ncbi:hypothetical protein NM208_g5286 [Fusarium decemcellulare]|uniref:Uncharacterized protein n=1 Tax=Fusarium decemcellulare TaxID=57161 RepID=A0ACC1SHV4_9HYPO|nr:hypothetical protein NM208_g5286 [Fusarium decemcellulare]